jgi:Calcineurin-like phosphoesterase
MSKDPKDPKNQANQTDSAAQQAKAIDTLKQQQKPHISGTHPAPFLSDPAHFRSGRGPAEIESAQAGQLIAVPEPKRSPPVMDLAEVIGSDAVTGIQNNGQIVFHTAGDTGAGQHEDLGQVANVMAMDFHRPNPADRPSFFLHLGDVTYNLVFGRVESKTALYQPQFYLPYSNYPGKILAIPGNHDSNPEEDPDSIDAFEANFCAPLPQTPQQLAAIVQSPKRTPMYQPGVYFRLDAPFVQILALFSNGGEHEGVIRGPTVGNDQWNFLGQQLQQIKAARANGPRHAFLLAIHHPPYSGGGGHTGSGQMLKDLDEAFSTAGIAPDAVLSGHAHV